MQKVKNAKDKVVHMFEEHVAKSGTAFTFDVHVPNKCQLSTYSYACRLSSAPRNMLRTMLAVNTNHGNIVSTP